MAIPSLPLVLLGLSFAAEAGPKSPPVIHDVIDRGDNYLAATDDGLYGASKTDHVWHKIASAPVLKGLTRFAQNSADPNELLYYSNAGAEPTMILPGWGKGAELSKDSGRTWRALSIPGIVSAVFLHPNGSIYAAESTTSTKPGPVEAGYFTTGTDPTRHYVTDHLLVSNDQGATWREITPVNLIPGYTIVSIFQDIDHSALVCVSAMEPFHATRVCIYQASDSAYQWRERSPFKDDTDRLMPDHPLSMGWGGANNSDMPANLENFFKYPYPRSGANPNMPTRFFETEKSAYVFHLLQPMSVTVTTVSMFADQPALHVVDDPDATRFWILSIKPKGKQVVFSDQKADNLNINYRDKKAEVAAYLRDPKVTNFSMDQAHPYSRTLDLARIFPFWKPGKYRMVASYEDVSITADGCIMGTPPFDVTILP